MTLDKLLPDNFQNFPLMTTDVPIPTFHDYSYYLYIETNYYKKCKGNALFSMNIATICTKNHKDSNNLRYPDYKNSPAKA